MNDLFECVCCELLTKTTLYPIGSGAFMEFCASCAEVFLAQRKGKDVQCKHGGKAL